MQDKSIELFFVSSTLSVVAPLRLGIVITLMITFGADDLPSFVSVHGVPYERA